MAVHFFTEDVNIKLKHKTKLKAWIKQSIEGEGVKLKELNYIFCSDDYLLEMNQQYLEHDTYTDILTFDNSEKEDQIQGDIFISVDRVKENAKDFAVSFEDELHRVIIHGALHLCGYPDSEPAEKKLMTEKEDLYLSKLVLLIEINAS